jgi:FkbM family methyltransferase
MPRKRKIRRQARIEGENKMTADQNILQKLETKLGDVTEENDLLLRQLHHVQEELERYYLHNLELEKRQASGPQNIALGKTWVDDKLPDALAENRRLQKLVETQKRIYQLEMQNALNVKLGNILINSVDSPGSLVSVPGKLARIWRQSGRRTPPEVLGGKGFDKVIDAYGKGGFGATEKLLTVASVGAVMQANAYTVLARKLMKSDRVNAATAARLAYEIDPKSYRLKWLAFRLHEAGDVIEAEAMLETLPPDMSFSESETRQLNEVRYEAQQARQSQAKQKSDFVERRVQIEKQLANLSRERDAQAKLAAERGREVELLGQVKVQLEKERQARVQLEQKRQAEEQAAQEKQTQMQLQLEQERHARLQLEREKQALSERRDEARALAAVREQLEFQLGENRCLLDNLHQVQEELKRLREGLNQLEQEKQALAQQHNDAQSERAEAHKREVEALAQMKEKLRQENQKLTVERDVQLGLVKAHDREFEALNLANAALARENQALAATYEAQIQAAQTRQRDLEELQQTKALLEKEKLDLMAKHDAQSKGLEARDREIDTLKRAKVQLEQERIAIRTRNQISARKIGKGDADIDDLIADLDLFFTGKSIVYADIGSFVGDVFLKIKQSAKKFRIHEAHLFEPNPVSYEQLTKKVRSEEGTVVHTYNVAVGSASGVAKFIKAKSMTKALSDEAEVGGAPADVFEANRVGLDGQRSIFTDGKINLLKIDVEGTELDVLASARELLASQSVDILYIEVGFNQMGTQQTYFAEVDRVLQPLGYRVLRIYEQKEEWMSDSPVLRRANIAYMSEKFANAHPLKLMLEIQELKDKLNELNKAKADAQST